MRKVEIVYGNKLIPVQVPEPVLTAAAEYGAETVAAIADIRQALKEAMADPMGVPPIREIHGRGSAVAFTKYPVMPNRFFI